MADASSTSQHNPSPLMQLMLHRRSCRAFARDREVPRELVERCLEAARAAPSACNRQPWRFVVVRDPALRERICTEAMLPIIPHPWLRSAPVIVVLGAELDTVTHRVVPRFSGVAYHLLDLGIAGEHLVLAAEELGLGTCWIGWFSRRRVRRILGIPRRIRIAALVPMGYPEPVDRPAAPRKELSELVHWDRW